jgi:dynactin complex subunit
MSLMFSPAEQKMLIGANVRTVEEAAIMGEPTMQMIGMGARALKAKAEAALQAANSTGKLVEENQALSVKLETLERTLEEMREAMQALQADTDKPKRGRPRMDEAA